jgi:translocation and assembly module TamA
MPSPRADPPIPPWIARARTLLVVALLAGTATARAAQDGLEDSAVGPPPPPAASDLIRYRVDVSAPSAMAAVLATSVDLIRWESYEYTTGEILRALLRDAPAQARETAAALGHFSAEVTLDVDRATTPVAIALRIAPGPATRVTDVRITVTGPAADPSSLGRAAIASVEYGWSLPEGALFTQAAWDAAKTRAVATLAATSYAAASLTDSEARVYPERESAELQVTIESGPAFHIGDIDVRGLERYPPELVRNFSTFERGDAFSQDAVDDYVRRLSASGYFASVQATLATDPAQAQNATLTLSVIEAQPKRLEFGLGYSTDTKYQASTSYTDVNVDGRGMQLHASARVESKVQILDLRFVRPPDADGWRGSLSAALDRTDIENLVTRTASVIARRQRIDERNTPAFSIGYYYDIQEPAGADQATTHALFADAQYTWRRTDHLLSPTTGWMANVEVGGGVPGASTKGFGRVIAKAAYWLPLGRDTQLYVRAEGGAVLAGTRDGIPSVFLFRTGGDTTVRGYAFDSLGVRLGDATVGGRYYAVGSTEVTQWIAPSWGVAAFVDAGNATETLSPFGLELGYGIGARVRTPIGPFRLDLAYGQATSSVRVHFSVGLSF